MALIIPGFNRRQWIVVTSLAKKPSAIHTLRRVGKTTTVVVVVFFFLYSSILCGVADG